MMLQPQHAIGLAHHGKRKAAEAPEGNERLSKRLSLLNLEHSGARLYIPVESSRPQISLSSSPPVPVSPASSSYTPPAVQQKTPPAAPAAAVNIPTPFSPSWPAAAASRPPAQDAWVQPQQPQEPQQPQQPQQQSSYADSSDMMVDDTKHKVYIYNLDDELSSDSEGESNGKDNAKLVFLSDVDKHLREAARDRAIYDHRQNAALLPPSTPPLPPLPPILRPICADEDGQMAGMQLVLYNDPSSLSVPREQDSVRQAILDARVRLRERQREKRDMLEQSRESEQDQQRREDDVTVEDDDAMEMD